MTTTITPEKGITYLCRINGYPDDGTEIALSFDGEYLRAPDRAYLPKSDRITLLHPVTQRITDEGGHWEPCTREAYARTHGVRFRVTYNKDAVPEDWERWVPDAPPVAVPTKPGSRGIVSDTYDVMIDVYGVVRQDGAVFVVDDDGQYAILTPNEVSSWTPAEIRPLGGAS